jgi:hypothetical protein
MKRYKAIFFFAIFLLVAISCGGPPSNHEIKQEFLKEHQNAVILSVGTGEGDSENVYMHIKYRLPGNDTEMEDVWLYQDLGSEKWENTWRRSTGYRKDKK